MDKKEEIVTPNKELSAYLDRYFPSGDNRRGDALVIVSFANILLHEKDKKTKEVAEVLRKVQTEGWKGKDMLEINKIGTDWLIEEHRKDKLTSEVANVVHKIPEENVMTLWSIILSKCNSVGIGTAYRQVVPSVIETYHLPIELEEFNGGRNRSKYYFKLLYYPLKILEHLKYIRYGSRGKIVRLV